MLFHERRTGDPEVAPHHLHLGDVVEESVGVEHLDRAQHILVGAIGRRQATFDEIARRHSSVPARSASWIDGKPLNVSNPMILRWRL